MELVGTAIISEVRGAPDPKRPGGNYFFDKFDIDSLPDPSLLDLPLIWMKKISKKISTPYFISQNRMSYPTSIGITSMILYENLLPYYIFCYLRLRLASNH